MSWAEEDWTVGLTNRAQQKVKELQVQQERLARESRQRQLQLDSTQTALNKQTLKYEEVRGELQGLQRELQTAREEAQACVRARERLGQELQVKQAQVCSLQGQLDASRTLTDNLNKEVKRLNTELEKVHSSVSSSAASPMFSTPCWNIGSPWDNNVGRMEDRHGHRGEADSKAFHVRQQLQFSDTPISSPFPRQPNKSTPNRPPFHQSDVSATPSALFPWEQDAPRSAARGRPAPLASSQSLAANYITGGQDLGGCGKTEELQKEADMRLSELQSRMCSLEGELRVEAERLRQTQDQLKQARGELSDHDQSLQRAQEQLSLAHTRVTQESNRASGAEQRLKQLQEELKCQRHSRLHAQQRTKELEKQHQRDVLELQKERQALEKQQQQEVNKLNQEIQQARKLHNALQSQAEKVSLQKQVLETEVQALKDKLKWTEGQLQDSQKKETQTQSKLMEALREAEAQTVSLEQSRRRVGSLEEEVKRLTQELAEALRLLKELQEEQPPPPAAPLQLSLAGQSFSPILQPPHGRATPYPPSVQTQRPPTTRGERAREATKTRSKYPKDREPGEGIESEHSPAFGSSCRELAGSPGVERDGKELGGSPGVEREGEELGGSPGVEREGEDLGGSPGVEREGEELGGEGTRKRYLREQKLEDPGTESSTKDPESAGSPTHCHSAPCCPRTLEEHPTEPQPHPPSKPIGPSTPEDSSILQELRQENGALRSELQDVREELQKRLEDLEAQRRAEAEARTRLKQLSRKQATQAGEREEQERERKKQREVEERERRTELEEEKAEVARLKEALAAMEAGAEREREERDGRVREEEEHESMWVEQNLQLKKQLAEVKTVLALERDERQTEKEEERKRLKKEETNELTLKLTQLEAELAILRSRGEQGVKNIPESNAPLTYLTLNHDHINSNMAGRDFKLLPSPDQHRLFCESTNQLNTAVCQTTQDLIKGEITTTKVPQLSSKEGGTLLDLMEESLLDLEDATTESHLGFFSSEEEEESLLGEASEELQKGVSATSDLAQEMEHLRREKTREARRARQYQAKLEALQNQVTRQTQQLTSAFDKQSQHITNLLGELHHKEDALLSQGAELQRWRDQLAARPAQTGVTEGVTEEEEQEKELKEAEDRETQVKVCALSRAAELSTGVSPPSSGVTDEASKTLAAECIAGAVTAVLEASPLPTTTTQDTRERMEAALANTLHERPADLTVDSQESVKAEKTQQPRIKEVPDPIVNRTDTNEQGQNGGGVDLSEALMSLRQENQQLKQRLQSAVILQRETWSLGENTTLPSSHGKIMDSIGTQEETGDKPTSLSREHDSVCSASGLGDLTSMRQELIPVNGGKSNAEGGGGGGGGEVVEEERELRTEEMWLSGSETVNQPQITSLEQQVVALQTELQALSAENQKQEEELVIWRLTANTPQNLSQDQAQPQPPCPSLGQEEPAGVGVCPGFSTVTVIREDELLLSCSSNRLYGRTLASRLQHCNAPEPKSEQQHPEKTSGHQEYIQEMLVDEDSDKENELSCVKPSKTKATHHQDDEKPTARTRGSSGETGRHQSTSDASAAITKDVRAHLMLQSKATELAHKGSPEKTKPNTPRATEQASSKEADSSLRNGSEDTRSAATQTEETTEASPALPAVAPLLHHVHTQTEEEEEEEELTESPPLSPVLPSRSGDPTLFSGSFPIPADPARLAERIRRNRSQMSAAYDDTEYEPYGLPEVVMKGFADIPSDASCPYIVRRGLLGTAAVPLPQRDSGQMEETD